MTIDRRKTLGALSAALLAPARAAAPEFRLAYFETYSPLSFVENGAMRGILVDVLDAVLAGQLGLACRHEGFDVTWGGDFNSAMKMLVARRGDIMIENALTMAYTLQRTPGGGEIRMLPNRMDQANFQLLLGKNSPHVARRDDIRRALVQFKRTQQYADVFRRYGLSVIR